MRKVSVFPWLSDGDLGITSSVIPMILIKKKFFTASLLTKTLKQFTIIVWQICNNSESLRYIQESTRYHNEHEIENVALVFTKFRIRGKYT